jgi:hypothetical protein
LHRALMAGVLAMPTLSVAVEPALPAVASSELRAQLEQTNYTTEELRNIHTLLELYSEPQGWMTTNRAKYFASDYKNIGPGPFYTLDAVYGKPNGFSANSVSNVTRSVKQVIAKADEVWIIVETNAVHSGPLFGVAATGKPISWPERSFFRFNAKGQVSESVLQPQQAEIYKQLGGKMTFPPGGWECKGCPDGLGKILPLDRAAAVPKG